MACLEDKDLQKIRWDESTCKNLAYHCIRFFGKMADLHFQSSLAQWIAERWRIVSKRRGCAFAYRI
ncbi:MAG: hypothetical protein ACO3MV_02285 [Flavobacteriales bacterium]